MVQGSKPAEFDGRADLTTPELLIIMENARRVLDGTHPVAGPEWTPVALVLARAVWRELLHQRREAV